MKKLVIFGNRQFAKIARYYFETDSDYEVVGFTVDDAFIDGGSYQGLPLVAYSEVTRHFPPGEHHLFVAVGYQGLNMLRQNKCAQAQDKGYPLASFVSTKAAVHSDLEIGQNSMIMEHAILQPLVRVGDNTIIWSASRLGFSTVIGNNCWIVSALTGESCVIGDNTFVGLNATVCSGVTVGGRNIVGAGALITQSTGDHQIYSGTASRASAVPSQRLPGF